MSAPIEGGFYLSRRFRRGLMRRNRSTSPSHAILRDGLRTVIGWQDHAGAPGRSTLEHDLQDQDNRYCQQQIRADCSDELAKIRMIRFDPEQRVHRALVSIQSAKTGLYWPFRLKRHPSASREGVFGAPRARKSCVVPWSIPKRSGKKTGQNPPLPRLRNDTPMTAA